MMHLAFSGENGSRIVFGKKLENIFSTGPVIMK